MFRIEEFEDFKLFVPSEQAKKYANKKTLESKKSNQKYLMNNPPSAPAKRISGSFIYAHPPDYEGCPTIDWTVNDWIKLLKEMKVAGIDTVIFHASVWEELGEAYYASDYFRNFYKIFPVVENMLNAAQKTKLHVYLGGYGSTVGWSKCLDRKTVGDQVNKQLRCMKELLTYSDLFDGIYFSPETAVSLDRNIQKEKFLNELYRRYFDELKSLSSKHKIMMSPATMHGDSNSEIIIDGWRSVLNKVPLDIMAPQDSIGCAVCTLDVQSAAWKTWKDICKNLDIKLWANIELFERHNFECVAPFTTAPAERIMAQINNVADWVEKIICWEYAYFTQIETKAASDLQKQIFLKE
jgi:hypothetical protein